MSHLTRLAASACTCLALAGFARADALTDAVLDGHILPTYTRLAASTAHLQEVAASDCDPQSEGLRAAWGEAFDAWVAANHLRFGPSEADNRAFAIAFWPDSRSRTPKALRSMLVNADPSVNTAETFATASIAVRGFYTLEYLMYDKDYQGLVTPDYTCAFVQAIARDLALNTQNILTEWQADYAAQMRDPNSRYHSDSEVHQELFKALTTGLEILTDMRLGRPLGSFDKPRPALAEARRSGRSLHNVAVQLGAIRELALLLAEGDEAITQDLNATFATAEKHIANLADDPSFLSVADPQKRFAIEALQQDVRDVKAIVGDKIGPRLGVEAGFNALDGD